MIKLVHGYQRDTFPDIIDQMHRLRKAVFHDRLKWEVPILGDWEIDEFDDENPLYVMSLNSAGQLKGCLRLLPTTGPNMLRDVFSKITDNCDIVENPFVWESSRFCVDVSNGNDQRDTSVISKTTVELIAGMGEVGLMASLDHVVTVYDAFLRRIIKQTGCHETLIGTPTRYGKIMTYAGLFAIDKTALDTFKRTWSLPSQLIAQENFAPLRQVA
jgi:acyl homoserine lactone synthase